ncbi:apolipoprotein N-acyltransferase [bacterium]|nr:apolipoprotein N-acyltransferase [bacterium]
MIFVLPISALISAAMLILSFPKFDLFFLAPIAFAPFWCALLKRHERAFREDWKGEALAAFLLGLVWYAGCVWWISYVTCAGMIALCAFIALLFALFTLGAMLLVRKGFSMALALALGYLFFELTVSYLFTGFPWLALGYALYDRPVLIQVSDLLGPHFLSFALAFSSGAIGELVISGKKTRYLTLAAAALLWLFIAAYGFFRISALDKEEPQKTFRASMIQLNLPPELKHDEARDEQTLQDYLSATKVASQRADLVLWPETGVPGIYNDYANTAVDKLRAFRQEVKTPLLCGLTWAEKNSQGKIEFFNAAALLDNAAMLPQERYYKKHLVIFGEYVPLERFLPFLHLLTPISSSYSPGKRSHVLCLRKGKETVKLGALICFEDVFPSLAREAAEEGAEVLVNITNDGWFFDSPGPYQHAALARFRAVENRRELLRSSNTGVTALVDRLGREKGRFAIDGKSVLVGGTFDCEAAVFPQRKTFYTAWGDMSVTILGIMALLIFALPPFARKDMVK